MSKIIIIDDSEVSRFETRKTLEHGGYQVIEAVDGIDGYACVKKHPEAKLIICDMNMPKMDGISMCGKIRELPEINKIPIFMLTTESTPTVKQRGKEVGIVAWIIKPFVPDTLLSAIKKIIK